MSNTSRTGLAFGFAFALGLLLSSVAWSAHLELTSDNDTNLFVPGAATTDRNYTQGARFTWVAEPNELPEWADQLARHVPGLSDRAPGGADRERGFGLAIGQEMYTPDAISRPVPESDDRPYAGWFYVSAFVSAADEHHHRSIEALVGVVGPDSRAADMQTWWHRSLGVRVPRGWSHQVRNEPTLGVRLEDRWRAPVVPHVNLIPHAGATLGNMRTDAFAGATVQLTTSRRSGFGPSRLLPTSASGRRVQGQLFARVEGRAVARDLTIDGNTFAPGPHASRVPLVGEVQMGAGVRAGRVGLRYLFSYTTQQLRERTDSHEYGSLAISF